MSDSPTDDIKIDFLNELRDYIPALREKLDKIKEIGPAESDRDSAELHRLVHTIRGASSLVKLHNLSRVASAFEDVVEAMVHHRLGVDPPVWGAMVEAIDYFDAYSREAPCNDSFDPGRNAFIIASLEEIQRLAQTADGLDDPSLTSIAADLNDMDDPPPGSDSSALDDLVLESDLLPDEADLPGIAEWPLAQDDADPVAEKASPDMAKIDASDGWEEIDLPQQELLEGFYQEAEDHFQDLGKALSQLERQVRRPAQPTPEQKELISLIRRAVHTIKGAAAVIKLKPIASWGHEFEDVLDWLYEEAGLISPNVLGVIAEAADMLERFVTSPQEVDPAQLDRLRAAFKAITASGRKPAEDTEEASAADKRGPSDAVPPAQRAAAVPSSEKKADPKSAPPYLGKTKTLRVDLAKVESLVNLCGELTITLSAFDQGMDELAGLNGEIDRARTRLNSTARDLELGYEVKAIQQLGAPSSMLEVPFAAEGKETAAFSDFDVLELDRYSELHLIIRSLSETAVDVSTISRQLSSICTNFDAFLNRLRILLSELHQKSMRMRMAPMSTITHRMQRTVRETAGQLNKKVQLIIHGEHIELDKVVWERLADPLMHLLRNAVDHGIEPKEERQRAGKPETATVQIAAVYQSNQVVIRVSDDGAGVDYEAIRRAVTRTRPGMDLNAMGQEELAGMLFQSGFSTRQTISEMSGRGVGLDVVKENIRSLKGRVGIETSAKEAGTTFRISLPLTMAVMQALLFEVGGRRYATALHDIKEILRVDGDRIEGRSDRTIEIGGRRLSFYELAEHLPDAVPGATAVPAPKRPLVLIASGPGWEAAVVIDRMVGQREIVIKSLGAHLGHVMGVAGATVLGDGTLVPILNLEELLNVESVRQHRPGALDSRKSGKMLEILVVDDSVSVRTVVARLMQRQGWQVQTAKDGMEAIELLHTRHPDMIILDVEMPRMNGYEFMSSMRAQSAFKDIPVIMLTSRAARKHREKAEALGVNGFMTKPFIDEEFIALVKNLSRPSDIQMQTAGN